MDVNEFFGPNYAGCIQIEDPANGPGLRGRVSEIRATAVRGTSAFREPVR